VTENSRIEDLRRRVHKDPASIAFAQLGEEYRRAGRFKEAITTCRTGLVRHPGYLSARVTLGRALIELGEIDQAEKELTQVLRSAPENLAAIRGLAEIHHRRGDLREALEQYQTALDLARHDPDLEQMVQEIGRELAPPPAVGATAALQAAAAVASAAPAAPMTGALASTVPAVAPAAASDNRPARLLGTLQIWLDAVVADRERREALA
jgi:tetratricopeptide (TPR) repeat protein